MMMIWEVLDIESTHDERAIKKAYAQQLRSISPEDDPEGFQTLRSAYERALEYAKSNIKQVTQDTVVLAKSQHLETSGRNKYKKNDRHTLSNISREEQHIGYVDEQQTITGLQNIIADLTQDHSILDWSAVLEQLSSVSFEVHGLLEISLAKRVADLLPMLDNEVMIKLDQQFKWSESYDRLAEILNDQDRFYKIFTVLSDIHKTPYVLLLDKFKHFLESKDKIASAIHWKDLLIEMDNIPQAVRHKIRGNIFKTLVESSNLQHSEMNKAALLNLDHLFYFTTTSQNGRKVHLYKDLSECIPEQAETIAEYFTDIRQNVTAPLIAFQGQALANPRKEIAKSWALAFVIFLALASLSIFLIKAYS